MIVHKNPSISMPDEFLEEIDEAVKLLDLRRSQAVRQALNLWLSINRDRIEAARARKAERKAS